jgi:hypothetical protein
MRWLLVSSKFLSGVLRTCVLVSEILINYRHEEE